MNFDQPKYQKHVAILSAEWRNALETHQFHAAIVTAGNSIPYYDDDQSPNFHANPYFTRWIPSDNVENAIILLAPEKRPQAFLLKPKDYWHHYPPIPNWLDSTFDLDVFENIESLTAELERRLHQYSRTALIGPDAGLPGNLNITEKNPKRLVNQLSFRRAFKTPFEIEQIESATKIAVQGHIAARKVFYEHGSEFDIHMAYLKASSQTEAQLPYQNIIALNEHAGTLHYQSYDRRAPEQHHSFLIDAGGRVNGFNSDITRTYSAKRDDDFNDLISALEQKQQELIDTIKPGMPYPQLHETMQLEISRILNDFGIFKCSAEAAFKTNLSTVFLPHGLGHLLGTQTHDVGGYLLNEKGDTQAPDNKYPSLRFTRTVEQNQVFTIEPGIYFIPMLLDPIRNSKDIDWNRVEDFLPYGGIRIEDNVLVTNKGTKNITRPIFQSFE